jgi:hypothetical protein
MKSMCAREEAPKNQPITNRRNKTFIYFTSPEEHIIETCVHINDFIHTASMQHDGLSGEIPAASNTSSCNFSYAPGNYAGLDWSKDPFVLMLFTQSLTKLPRMTLYHIERYIS